MPEVETGAGNEQCSKGLPFTEDGSKSSSSLVTTQTVTVMLYYWHGLACEPIQGSSDVAQQDGAAD